MKKSRKEELREEKILDEKRKEITERTIDVDFPYSQIIMIVASFALGLLDMMFLYQAIHRLTGLGNGTSMFTALIIAEVANFSALQAGKANGEFMETKTINRHSRGAFAAWVFLGLIYTAIRVLNFVQGMGREDFNLEGEIIQLCILAISFIGTGVTIMSASRIIFDHNASRCRKKKKEFNLIREDLSDAYAELTENFGNIINYDANYENLDIQKKKIAQSILQSEKATLSDIEGKVLQNNPGINPMDTHAVVKEIIKQREEEDEL